MKSDARGPVFISGCPRGRQAWGRIARSAALALALACGCGGEQARAGAEHAGAALQGGGAASAAPATGAAAAAPIKNAEIEPGPADAEPIAGAAALPDVPGAKAHERQAIAAYEKKDYAAYAQGMQKALALHPRSPRLLYNAASGAALTGQKEEALRLLGELVRIKVLLDPAGDSDFDAIKDASEFRAVRDQMAALRKPVGRSEAAFRIRQRDLIPEGIAFDPGSGRFYVGSVRRRTIVAVDAKGATTTFVRERADGLGSVLGLEVDPPRRALWACSAALPQMAGYTEAERGQTGAYQFDLAGGKLTRKVMLPAPEPASPRQCNDLTVSAAGDVFVSDSAAGAVYVLRAGEQAFAALIAPGGFGSPQGLALSADQKTLFVADYGAGLFTVDLTTRAKKPLAHPDDLTLLGVDGLDLHGGDLLAIQNGIAPHRVLRLTLSEAADRVTRAEILEMNNPLFDEPTLGVVAGGWFHYIANSQWARFNEDGSLFPPEKLAEPVVLKVKL